MRPRAARPEIGEIADHRPAGCLQPIAIVRGEPVLPLRDGDVGVDVDFALAEHVRRMRRLFGAVLGIGFPRIFRAAEPGLARSRLCRGQRVRAEFDELMQLSIEAGTLKRPVAYEKYVDESFAKAAKPAAISL